MNKFYMIVSFASLVAFGCAGAGKWKAAAGPLTPCPASPNCVSSQTADPGHKMAAMPYTGTEQAAMERLAAILAAMPRVQIVERREHYLHAVFVSKVFRFKDDVEFVTDDAAKVIHFRSASRLGYSDFGANRKRMEDISRRFSEAAP